MPAVSAPACVTSVLPVCVISARPYGQRAVLKFGQYTGANYMAGRYTPGIPQRFAHCVERERWHGCVVHAFVLNVA